jgi:single-strand DNA-binding protein
MRGLNKAYLIGHIGSDPELRTTASGKQVVKLSLATPNRRKVGEEWVETPDWHQLTAFDRTAEWLAQNGKKGMVLAVECSIRPGKWTDRENVVHHEVSLIVDRVLWLNARGKGEPSLADPLPPGPEEEGPG